MEELATIVHEAETIQHEVLPSLDRAGHDDLDQTMSVELNCQNTGQHPVGEEARRRRISSRHMHGRVDGLEHLSMLT
jgi:hypothetical protein